jgi:hypothetical protein
MELVNMTIFRRRQSMPYSGYSLGFPDKLDRPESRTEILAGASAFQVTMRCLSFSWTY